MFKDSFQQSSLNFTKQKKQLELLYGHVYIYFKCVFYKHQNPHTTERIQCLCFTDVRIHFKRTAFSVNANTTDTGEFVEAELSIA